MSKKAQKKVAKAKAEAKVQAAVGMNVVMGVAADVRDAAPAFGSEGFNWDEIYAQAEAEERKIITLVNDGPDPIVVTVNQAQFNRAGFDILMNETMAPEVKAVAAVEVAPEQKTVRARIKDGFLGMTRRMYRAGKNGQEILEANRDARLAAGYEEAQAMIRAKKDYGYVVREAKAERKAAEAKAPAFAVVANN